MKKFIRNHLFFAYLVASISLSSNIGLGLTIPELRGHEVQNGDWSVIYRAEKIISEAIRLLKWQVEYGQWQLPQSRENHREVFRDHADITLFFQFIDSLEFPDFAEFAKPLSCNLFCEKNLLFYKDTFNREGSVYKFTPQFLRDIGKANNSKLRKIQNIFTTQRHILTRFIQHAQGLNKYNWIYPMENAKKFFDANKFLNSKSMQNLDLLEITDKKNSISTASLYSVLNYSIFKNILDSELNFIGTNEIEIISHVKNTPSSQDVNAASLMTSHHIFHLNYTNIEKQSQTTSFPINFTLYRIELNADEKDENHSHDYYINIDSTYFTFNGLAPNQYEEVTSNSNKVEPFLFTFIKANQILREAQKYIDDFLNDEILKNIIKAVKPLNYANYLNSEPNIKNFDYNMEDFSVIVTKSFYERFGYYKSEVEKQIFIDQIKRLLIHEALHLKGYNETESLQASTALVDNMHLQNSIRQQNLVALSGQTNLLKRVDGYSQDYMSKLTETIEDNLGKQYDLKLIKETRECFLNKKIKSCSQNFSNMLISTDYELTLFQNGEKINTVFTVPMSIQLNNTNALSHFLVVSIPTINIFVPNKPLYLDEKLDILYYTHSDTTHPKTINFICENEDYTLEGFAHNSPIESNSWTSEMNLLRAKYLKQDFLPQALSRQNFEKTVNSNEMTVTTKSVSWELDERNLFTSPNQSLSFVFSSDYKNLFVLYVDENFEKKHQKIGCHPQTEPFVSFR